MNEHEKKIEAQIDAALSSYPLVPLPEGFTQRVMARVNDPANERIQPVKPWRLYPLDLAMAVFFTTFFWSILYTLWWAVTQIDPEWVASVREFWQSPGDGLLPAGLWLLVILVITICIEVSAVALWLLVWWDRSASRKIAYLHNLRT